MVTSDQSSEVWCCVSKSTASQTVFSVLCISDFPADECGGANVGVARLTEEVLRKRDVACKRAWTCESAQKILAKFVEFCHLLGCFGRFGREFHGIGLR